MSDQCIPATVLPPIAIVASAAAEDIRAQIAATHKALLFAETANRLVVVATLGCSNEELLRGESIAVGDGFVGWAASSASAQARANLQYVPRDAPQLTGLEVALGAKSAIAAPVLEGGSTRIMVASFVCHGFYVFVLEDLDKLVAILGQWQDRLLEALGEEESSRWLAEAVAPFAPPPALQEPAPVEAAAADAAGGPHGSSSDYTEQDVQVLMSVFGVDLTTTNPRVARVLRADVGSVLNKDVGELLKGEPQTATPPVTDADVAPPVAPAEAGATSASGEPIYSTEDVGRMLSVFGVKVEAGDSPIARALGADVGKILTSDVSDLFKKGSSGDGDSEKREDAEPEVWHDPSGPPKGWG